MTIDALPDEIIAHIFSFLPCIDLAARVRPVCRRWLAIASDPLAVGPNCARLRYSSCLHQHRPSLGVRAATFGHIHCLADARERGCQWGPDLCVAAAANGRLAALVWLRRQGCPWDDDVCRGAASRGHVECLAFAHEKGRSLARCDWKKAVHRGDIGVVEYGCKHGWAPKKRMLRIAVARDHVDMVRCLLAYGCPWDPDCLCRIAIDSGSLNCIDYLHERDRLCGMSLGPCAIKARRPDVIAYIESQGQSCDKRHNVVRAGTGATIGSGRRHVAAKHGPLTILADNHKTMQPGGVSKKGHNRGARERDKKEPPTFDAPFLHGSW
ncbi:Ankyrin repeat domain containing protein [Pandoravirus salinus]|uniref:Ankyrin repeat domain containing protein n=1 Tax=Pandoravirus salinus TaxID=1349410 RepID=S4W1L2_9VIRU|nr:ankyrin repeat domain [Pandoravirus salinus]AGO85696.1 Ankyrin repeat domain containing protein [Pandoravirus salinus]